jgi:hypothetical protein
MLQIHVLFEKNREHMLVVGLYSSEFFLWTNKFVVMNYDASFKSLNPAPPCLKFLYGHQSSYILGRLTFD